MSLKVRTERALSSTTSDSGKVSLKAVFAD